MKKNVVDNTKLSERELSQITEDDLKEKIAERDVAISAYKVMVMELKLKNLTLELSAEKNSLVSLRTELGQVKLVRANNLKTIAKKKGLKDGWGYNPDTGEIVEN